MTVSSVAQAAHGTVARGESGLNVRYTPAQGYTGPDSFSYTVTDGTETSVGTVVMTVRPDNRAPTAGDDFITVLVDSSNNLINVLGNDSDPDDNAMSIAGVSTAANGIAGISPGGASVVYTPNRGFSGTDDFTYSATDGLETVTARVTVRVQSSLRTFVVSSRLYVPAVLHAGILSW